MSLLVTAVLAPTATAAAPGYDWCTGPISIDYLGAAQELLFTRNNHSMPGSEIYWSGPVAADARSVSPGMEDTVSPSGARQNGRAYLSESCTDGQYDPSAYARFQLLDRALSWTVDLSAATCGCDATIYLVSMAQNDDPSGCGDYYCDANSVCGVACTEMDVMEANVGAFLTTAHAASDPSGAAAGLGGGEPGVWSGPRDLTSADYGPSPNATINTLLPFQASASFPTDPASGLLASVDMILSQVRRARVSGREREREPGFKPKDAGL